MPTQSLQVTDSLSDDAKKKIVNHIVAYNIETFGESDRRDLAIPLEDSTGTVCGGLVGYTGRGWLYIQLLFIPEQLRGQGLATKLLDLAEQEARSRGAIGAYIDTMNPQALRLYVRQGYSQVGELKGLKGGISVTWLAKRF